MTIENILLVNSIKPFRFDLKYLISRPIGKSEYCFFRSYDLKNYPCGILISKYSLIIWGSVKFRLILRVFEEIIPTLVGVTEFFERKNSRSLKFESDILVLNFTSTVFSHLSNSL